MSGALTSAAHKEESRRPRLGRSSGSVSVRPHQSQAPLATAPSQRANAVAAVRMSDAQRRVRVGIVRAQIELMRRYARETGDDQHARWLLKEVIYRVWEQPQVPVPRFDKYSLWRPWSPRAFARLSSYTKGARRPAIEGLRLDHIIPRGILAEELLSKDPGSLEAFLDTHFTVAVITVEDDRQLNTHGMRARMPDGWSLGSDPWIRYERAHLDPAAFLVPCEERPELATDTHELLA
jgi:hypothetical protein